jgi:glutathione S-transferase
MSDHARVAKTSYDLHYWPAIQGRGEYVRLALEEAGAPYRDVVRLPESKGGGIPAMMKFMRGRPGAIVPFAPPFLKSGKLIIAQTANILAYLAPRHRLVPASEAARLHANQLQLTIADLVFEAHETHHPIAGGLYYEDQKPEAAKRAKAFVSERIPKYLSYLEKLLASTKVGFFGRNVSYVDLSTFQTLSGLEYAFPKAMAKISPTIPRLLALRDRIAARPRIATYLASPRRLAFNEHGLFRRYPELDFEG